MTAVSKLSEEELRLVKRRCSGNLESPEEPQIPTDLSAPEPIVKQTSVKEDLEILNFIRITMSEEILNSLTEKERIVISLCLGSIDGKYFSTESIATFLEIEQQEVRDIIGKVLMSYRNNLVGRINQTIEEIINGNQLLKK